MPNLLYDALLGNLRAADAPCLRLPDSTIWTYGELKTRTERLAGALRSLGLQPGERIAARLAKSPEGLALYLACLRAGLVFLPINPALTHGELEHVLRDAAPALLLCEAEELAPLAGLAAQYGAQLLALCGGDGLMRMAENAGPLTKAAHGDAQTLAAILYTSGTTGRPKGVMLSHQNLLCNARALSDAWQFTHDDVLLHGLPVFHTHGLFVAGNVVLLAGASMLYQPRFETAEFIRLMPRATTMMGVPTFYTRLLAHHAFDADVARNMRLFISGSAPLLASTHTAFQARCGHRILERYGMTETGMITSNPYHGARRAGTVGRALDGVKLRIAEPDTGAALAPGEIGVVELSGPNVFAGYRNMPDKTAAEFRDDGYFITGDLGCLDEDGYLTIVGRARDLIISGGENIYPKEVESEIDRIDGVAESAVFGVAHPDLGEATCAAVVPKPGVTLQPGNILQALDGVLARFKQPRHVVFLAELPRNSMSKVQKNLLRETCADVFKPTPG
ncbi:MAG: AMP-binding protein [Paracoccaceae bacterium]